MRLIFFTVQQICLQFFRVVYNRKYKPLKVLVKVVSGFHFFKKNWRAYLQLFFFFFYVLLLWPEIHSQSVMFPKILLMSDLMTLFEGFWLCSNNIYWIVEVLCFQWAACNWCCTSATSWTCCNFYGMMANMLNPYCLSTE